MYAACLSRTELGRPDESSALLEAIDRYGQSDATGSWVTTAGTFVESRLAVESSTITADGPYVDTAGRVVVAWARIDDRDVLLDTLDVDSAERSTVSDSALILQAYDRWGADCVHHLRGDYSFVVHDPADGSVFVARDPFGVRPCYFHLSDELFAVSTTAAAFHAIESLTLAPSEAWIARYLIGQSMSHTATAYDDVAKLAGGHRLSFRLGDATATIRPERWFEFVDDAPMAFERDDTHVERYRSVLVEAVGERIRTDAPLGVETSGGIDSSTCLGFAADLWERSVDDIHAFGFVTSEDEPDFILQTSEQHGIENNVILDHGGRAANVPDPIRTLTVLGYPEEHLNGSGHTPFYVEAQRRGVRALLSGFGGDEGVTNSGALLDRELIDHRRFDVLWLEMFGPWWQRPLRFVRRIQRGRKGSKMTSRLSGAVRSRWNDTMLSEAVVEKYDLRSEYLDGAAFDDGFRSINAFVLGNRIHAAFVPTRLENCSLMAQSYGIDYRWPLLDPELVQQYLSTPAIEKRKGPMGRYLHRRAMEGVVPAKVQWKQSKDMGDPLGRGDSGSGPGSRMDLQDLHPLLAPIVDVPRLERAVDAVVNGPADRQRWIGQQVRRLGELDTWLRRYHPLAKPETDAAAQASVAASRSDEATGFGD